MLAGESTSGRLAGICAATPGNECESRRFPVSWRREERSVDNITQWSTREMTEKETVENESKLPIDHTGEDLNSEAEAPARKRLRKPYSPPTIAIVGAHLSYFSIYYERQDFYLMEMGRSENT